MLTRADSTRPESSNKQREPIATRPTPHLKLPAPWQPTHRSPNPGCHCGAGSAIKIDLALLCQGPSQKLFRKLARGLTFAGTHYRPKLPEINPPASIGLKFRPLVIRIRLWSALNNCRGPTPHVKLPKETRFAPCPSKKMHVKRWGNRLTLGGCGSQGLLRLSTVIWHGAATRSEGIALRG